MKKDMTRKVFSDNQPFELENPVICTDFRVATILGTTYKFYTFANFNLTMALQLLG